MDSDIVATEVYTSHYTGAPHSLSALVYALDGAVLMVAEPSAVLHLADKHIVYRYIRINEMGQAAPIAYNDLDYSPREREKSRTFLDPVGNRPVYAGLRDTAAKTYPSAISTFLSEELANKLMTDDVRNRTIAKVIAGQTDENDVSVNNVVFTSLGKGADRQVNHVYSGAAIIDRLQSLLPPAIATKGTLADHSRRSISTRTK